MSSVNKVILLGRLGKDPESRMTSAGMPITTFSIATSESFKKGENWEEKTEWHNIVMFNKTAEYAVEKLRKGFLVYIEGKLSTSSWDDESGQKKYKTEIIGNSFKNFTPKSENNQGNQQSNNNSNSQDNDSQYNAYNNDPKDDLPF